MLCKYAAALQGAGLQDSAERSSREMAELLAGAGVPIGKTSINTHRTGGCVCGKPEPAPRPSSEPTGGSVDVGPEGGEFKDIRSDEPLTDWTHVFQKFGLDPEVFEIVGDTVRMSCWESGDRVLYAYRARFTRKVESLVDFDSLQSWIRGWEPAAPEPATSEPLAYVVGLADLQLGKGEGDGTPGTLRRAQASLGNIVQDIRSLRERGIIPKTLVLGNMGDHVENVYSSYANQAYTVDMNNRQQINAAIDLNMQWIMTLAPYFDEVIYASCLCNHGQLSRQGGKTNMTDDSDNATGLIADTLERVCRLNPALEHVRFVTPWDEMITTVQVHGVSIAMAHGHKISGAEENWLARQSQNLSRTRRFHVDIWFTAHKHHANLRDFGPYTRIQCTTLDPGSKYFEDMTGEYSRPGVTVFLAGESLPGKWSHYNIF